MIRKCFLLLLTILPLIHVSGADSFTIFVPDKTDQQLLSVHVTPSAEGVAIKQGAPFKLPFSPAGTAVHPNGKYLIVTAGDGDKTAASSLEVLDAGKLRLLSTTRLDNPHGYTSVDRNGRYFMIVSYRTGAVSTYHIDEQGMLGGKASSMKTPKPEAHCILTTPDNRFAYIPCVKNNNALFQYAFDQSTGKLSPLEPFNAMPPAMFGPRHIAYHPDLPIAYFSNEQQLGVSVYNIGPDGQLTDRQHATTMQRRSPFEQGKRDLHASDIALTPDGKLLFVAVRDFNGDEDCVFTFRIEDDGKLSHADRTKVGDIPWKLDVSPNGNYLIVSESGANRITIFEIDPYGSLSPSASIDLPSGATDLSIVTN